MARLQVSKIGARFIAVVGILSVVSACSSLKIAYGFADDALESRAEQYLDLDSDGEAKVEAEIARLLNWHRTVMLPRYAAFLNGVADVNDTGSWQRREIAQAFQGFKALLDETALGAAPFIANVLKDHTSPERVEYLRAQMAVYIREELAEEQASFEDRLTEQVDRRVRNFERFVGPLRDEQIDIIRRHTAPALTDRNLWLRHLDRRHQALADYLQSDPETIALTTFVHTWTTRGYDIVDPEYAKISEARWNKLEELHEDMLSSLDGEQRAALSLSLRSYAADMMDLATGS